MAGDKQSTVLRPHGTIVIDDPELGRKEFDTLQCCHCGLHWHVVPGSGRRRGYCLKCNAVTCGGKACDGCYPLEKRLDDAERGRLIIP